MPEVGRSERVNPRLKFPCKQASKKETETYLHQEQQIMYTCFLTNKTKHPKQM